MKTKLLLVAYLTYALMGCASAPTSQEPSAKSPVESGQKAKNVGSNRHWCTLKPNDYRCAK